MFSCVAPLSPLWPKRRQDSRSENLLNALEPASLGCEQKPYRTFFFRKEWNKNAAFWKKYGRNPIFEENRLRCRELFIVISVFDFVKGTLSIPSCSQRCLCRLLFLHNAMEKHQGVSPRIFDSNAYDGTMNQLGFAVAFRSRGSTYFSSLPRRGFKARCCAEWWNVWWKIWKDTKYQELVEMLQNATIDWL